MASYDLFKQIWIVVEHRQHLLQFFCNFGTIVAAEGFIAKTSVEIAWHEPNNMPPALAPTIRH